MDRSVIFRDRQELQSADLNNVQAFAAATIDRLTEDAIASGLWFTGFAASPTATWEATVGAGRVYTSGAMYRRSTATVLNFYNVRPLSQKKIVAIVGWAQTVETDVQPRDFLIDVELNTTQPESVAMEALRSAEINLVAGAEAPQPTTPQVAANNVVIALATLGTGGIESIEMQDQNLLPSAFRNLTEIQMLNLWRAAVGTAIDTIRTDLASLAARFADYALLADLNWLRDEVATVKATANRALQMATQLASAGTFLLDFHEDFETEVYSDKLASGYAARITDGALRFPMAAQEEVIGGIDLLNPSDPKVATAGDLILPTYSPLLRVDGRSGTRSALTADLLAYSNVTQEWVTVDYVRNNVWSSWDDVVTRKYQGVPGVAYAANSGRPATTLGVDVIVVGNKIYRFVSVAEDVPGSGLWTLTYNNQDNRAVGSRQELKTTSSNLTGQGRAQVFFNANPGWLCRVAIEIAEKAAAGDIRVLVTRVSGSRPDLNGVLSSTLLPLAQIQTGVTVLPIIPAYINPGERFAVVLLSSGNHKIRLYSADQALNGQHLALSDTDRFVSPAGQEGLTLGIQLYFARFNANEVAIDLNPLALGGGISAFGIDCARILPPGTVARFQVQVAGIWRDIEHDGGAQPAFDWGSLPTVVPFRIVLTGTVDLMPAITRGTSKTKLIAARTGTAFKHVSAQLDVGASKTATKARLRLTVENWDALHTLTPKLIVAGAPVAASSVEDQILPSGVLIRTAHFSFAANRYFTPVVEGARHASKPPFIVLDRYDYAAG